MLQRSPAGIGGPYLSEFQAGTNAPTGVVLVLHGGRKVSQEPTHPLQGPVLRMRPFARSVSRAGRAHGVAAWSLRYRLRGWNGAAEDPVADTRWALDEVRRRFGDVRVVLIGHSMGGRAALRAASDPLVAGVVALAPWLPDQEKVEHLAGRQVLIAHGDQERMTDPADSYAYALRARKVTPEICRFVVQADGHAMLRRATDWHRLATAFALGVLNVHPHRPAVANALRATPPEGLNVPLQRG